MRELEPPGFEKVTYLDVQEDGLLDLENFKRRAARHDPGLGDVVKHEIASFKTFRRSARSAASTHHLPRRCRAGDRAKVVIDLAKLPVDLMSLASQRPTARRAIGAL